jgi:hypothetical protein
VSEISDVNATARANAPSPAPQGAAAILDHILAQGERHIEAVRPTLPLDLTFGFEGHDFKARFDRAPGGALLRLEADLGPIPFTSENAAARLGMLARAAGLKGVGISGRCIVHKGRLKLLSQTHMPEPADGHAVLSALAICLLEVQPTLGAMGGGAPQETRAAPPPATVRRFSAERRALPA